MFLPSFINIALSILRDSPFKGECLCWLSKFGLGLRWASLVKSDMSSWLRSVARLGKVVGCVLYVRCTMPMGRNTAWWSVSTCFVIIVHKYCPFWNIEYCIMGGTVIGRISFVGKKWRTGKESCKGEWPDCVDTKILLNKPNTLEVGHVVRLWIFSSNRATSYIKVIFFIAV